MRSHRSSFIARLFPSRRLAVLGVPSLSNEVLRARMRAVRADAGCWAGLLELARRREAYLLAHEPKDDREAALLMTRLHELRTFMEEIGVFCVGDD